MGKIGRGAACAVVALVALVGCDGSGRGVTSRADRNDIKVTVEWVAARDVDAVCKAAGAADGERFEACAASGPTTCTIYAVQPRNFEDRAALQALGHEAWHCFGARH
ncbi:MAG TPA: hypothetical protein VIG97_07415 [Luteimonas sp.]